MAQVPSCGQPVWGRLEPLARPLWDEAGQGQGRAALGRSRGRAGTGQGRGRAALGRSWAGTGQGRSERLWGQEKGSSQPVEETILVTDGLGLIPREPQDGDGVPQAKGQWEGWPRSQGPQRAAPGASPAPTMPTHLSRPRNLPWRRLGNRQLVTTLCLPPFISRPSHPRRQGRREERAGRWAQHGLCKRTPAFLEQLLPPGQPQGTRVLGVAKGGGQEVCPNLQRTAGCGLRAVGPRAAQLSWHSEKWLKARELVPAPPARAPRPHRPEVSAGEGPGRRFPDCDPERNTHRHGDHT